MNFSPEGCLVSGSTVLQRLGEIQVKLSVTAPSSKEKSTMHLAQDLNRPWAATAALPRELLGLREQEFRYGVTTGLFLVPVATRG